MDQVLGSIPLIHPNENPEDPSAAFGDTLKCTTIGHVIVCGHSKCKVFDLLLDCDDSKPKLLVHKMLESVEERFNRVYTGRPSHDHRELLIQESVLQQLANVQARSDVQSRLKDGTLKLHAWVRNDEAASIVAFNPSSGQFDS